MRSLDRPSAPALSEEQEALLHLRAERYARQPDGSAEVASDVVVFTRGGGRYALPLQAMREIRPLQHLTRIPGASPVVPGLFHYRGELLGVHDLGAWLGAGGKAPSAGWVLVVQQGDSCLGLLAEDVSGIEPMLTSQLSPVPVTLGERGALLRGVLPGPLLLLLPERLFSTPGFFRAF